MISHLRKLFHWPSISVDVAQHCKLCRVCQRHTKKNPKSLSMQEREVITVPSERVCVDLVGPFPKARGGSSSCSPTLTWPPGGLRLYLSEKLQQMS